jgi:DNA-binding MarR family transcriptional regulator
LSRLVRAYQFRDRDLKLGCGLSVTQCHALDVLVAETSVTVQGLGKRLGLNKSNASRVVDFLEARGLAHRAADEGDARIRWVRPTAAGRRVNKGIHRDLQNEYAKMLSRFSRAFVRDAAILLDALADRAVSKERSMSTPVHSRRGARS